MASTWNEGSQTSALPEAAQPAPAHAVSAPIVKKKKGRARLVLPVLTVAAVAIGGGIYLHGLGSESTDDAQVEGHIVSVATRVPGQVSKVLVHDNQLVNQGDVLVEIDDRDYQAKLISARADLLSAQTGLVNAKAQMVLVERTIEANLKQAKGGVQQASAGFSSVRAAQDQGKAEVAVAESRRSLAESELKRAEALRSHDAISQAEYDAKLNSFQQADGQLNQAKARLLAADATLTATGGAVESAQGRLAQANTGSEQLEVAKATVGMAEARVVQAEAALRIAELNTSYTKILAPVAGVVSRRSVEPGQMVSPERPMLALVSPDDVWVVANFKEDQVARIRTGQKTVVRIDAYGRQDFSGHVESIAGASGSRFSLLPPDNASGNFIKVVQRIPVLIRLDNRPEVPFRPGMSAYVTVNIKSH